MTENFIPQELIDRALESLPPLAWDFTGLGKAIALEAECQVLWPTIRLDPGLPSAEVVLGTRITDTVTAKRGQQIAHAAEGLAGQLSGHLVRLT